HGPGAGRRQDPADRPRRRRVRAGRHPLRAADGPAPLPGRNAAGHASPGPLRRPPPPPPPAAGPTPRPGDNLPQVPGEGPRTPPRRYHSAWALAEELGRFQKGEPIHARPVGPVGALVRWARRRPTAAALVVVSALAALLLFAVLVASDLQIRRERHQTEQAYQ